MDTQLDTSQLPNLPVISRKRFADLVGVSEDTVNGWINKGYLQTLDIGRYRLINLAALTRRARDRNIISLRLLASDGES